MKLITSREEACLILQISTFVFFLLFFCSIGLMFCGYTDWRTISLGIISLVAMLIAGPKAHKYEVSGIVEREVIMEINIIPAKLPENFMRDLKNL